MKKEILMLIIGILIGAIITTGIFLVLKGNSEESVMGDRGSMRGEMPSMDDDMLEGGKGGTRPDNDTDNNETTNTSEEDV